MAPSKKEEDVRLKNNTVREVVSYTNANLGQWKTRQQQDAAFQTLITQRRLQYRPDANKQRQPHTTASLRRAMQAAIRRGQKPHAKDVAAKTLDDFFELGGKLFKPAYLEEIDFDETEQEDVPTHGDLPSKDATKKVYAGADHQKIANLGEAKAGNVRGGTDGRNAADPPQTLEPTSELNAGQKRRAPDSEQEQHIEISDSSAEYASESDRPTKKRRVDRHAEGALAGLHKPAPFDDGAANVHRALVKAGTKRSADALHAAESTSALPGAAGGRSPKRMKMNRKQDEHDSHAHPAQPPRSSQRERVKSGTKRPADALQVDTAVATLSGGAAGPPPKRVKVNGPQNDLVSHAHPANSSESALPNDKPVATTQGDLQTDIRASSKGTHKNTTSPDSSLPLASAAKPKPTIPTSANRDQSRVGRTEGNIDRTSLGGNAAPGSLRVPPRTSREGKERAVPPVTKPMSRSEVDTRMSDNRILEARDTINYHVQAAASFYCRERSMKWAEPVRFLPRPDADLEELYKIFLGTEEWRERIIQLEYSEKPGKIAADHAIHGLIAASIQKEVFQTTLPWNIEAQWNKHFGEYRDKFEWTSECRGYVFEHTLKHTMWMHATSEENHKGQFQQHADKLTNALVITLMPHLQRLTKAPGNETYDHDWITHINLAFHAAIILKSKLDAAHDSLFEYVWVKGDTPYVKREMVDLYEGDRPRDTIATLFPGIWRNTLGDTGPKAAARTIVLARFDKQEEQQAQQAEESAGGEGIGGAGVGDGVQVAGSAQ